MRPAECVTPWWILWKKSHHPGFPHCPHCVGKRKEFERHLALHQSVRASRWGSYIFQHTIFVPSDPAREHCLLPPRNDPSTVSAHFFQTFQEKKSLIETFQRGCVCTVPGPHLTIYCCWLERQGGVVIGATVLQPDNPGSVSLDSQSPTYGRALQLDFLSATGMQLWRDGAQPKMYPDKPLQNNTTQACQAKEQNLTQLVRHYLLNPDSFFLL